MKINIKKFVLLLPFLFIFGITNAQNVCSSPNLTKDLYLGMTDLNSAGEVTKLQFFLKNYYNSSVFRVDGKFRSPTKIMVSLFQKENNLIVTGVVGYYTRSKMNNICSTMSQSVTTQSASQSSSATSAIGQNSQTLNLYEQQTQIDFCSKVTKTISAGSVGEEVKQLQGILSKIDSKIAKTGVFGSYTESVIKRYQGQKGIYPSGSLGVQTLSKLRNEYCTSIAQTPTEVSNEIGQVSQQINPDQNFSAQVPNILPVVQPPSQVSTSPVQSINPPIQPSINPTIPSVPTQALPEVSISAAQSSIAIGQGTTITWRATDASNCSLFKDNLNFYTSSQYFTSAFVTGPINASTTYKLTCTNSAGSKTASVAITTIQNTQSTPNSNGQIISPEISSPLITSDVARINSGSATMLRVTAPTAATSCVLSGGAYGSGQAVSLPNWSGTSGVLSQNTTFVLKCIGFADKSISVDVTQANPSVGPQVVNPPTSVTPATPSGVITNASANFSTYRNSLGMGPNGVGCTYKGINVKHGESIIAYQAPESSLSCTSENRVCNNGTLTGTFEHPGCLLKRTQTGVQPPYAGACVFDNKQYGIDAISKLWSYTLPGGYATVANAFESQYAKYEHECKWQGRKCVGSGKMTGTYNYSSCTGTDFVIDFAHPYKPQSSLAVSSVNRYSFIEKDMSAIMDDAFYRPRAFAAVSNSDSNKLVLTMDEDLFVSLNGGSSWQRKDLVGLSGLTQQRLINGQNFGKYLLEVGATRLENFASSLDLMKIFVPSGRFGFFSSDGGSSWNYTTAPEQNLGVSTIGIWTAKAATQDGSTLYIGKGSGIDCNKVDCQMDSPIEAGGVFASNNNGITFNRLTGAGYGEMHRSISASGDGSILFSTIIGGGKDQDIEKTLYSKDGGATWKQRNIAPREAIQKVVFRDNNKKGFAIPYAGGSCNYPVYFSEDGGEIWYELPSPKKCWIDMDVSADGNTIVAVSSSVPGATSVIYSSSDGGFTWTANNFANPNASMLMTGTNFPRQIWGSVRISADGTKIYAVTQGFAYFNSNTTVKVHPKLFVGTKN